MEELYCKVLVDSQDGKGRLLERIAHLTSGSVERCSVSSADLQADLEDNEDHRQAGTSQEAEFLYYRYYLDVEPTEPAARDRYVEAVGRLLEGLWRSGCKAVAACEFEEELPRRGGYNPQIRHV